jgi:hypothetical protein
MCLCSRLALVLILFRWKSHPNTLTLLGTLESHIGATSGSSSRECICVYAPLVEKRGPSSSVLASWSFDKLTTCKRIERETSCSDAALVSLHRRLTEIALCKMLIRCKLIYNF